jgi:hypothetical protein
MLGQRGSGGPRAAGPVSVWGWAGGPDQHAMRLGQGVAGLADQTNNQHGVQLGEVVPGGRPMWHWCGVQGYCAKCTPGTKLCLKKVKIIIIHKKTSTPMVYTFVRWLRGGGFNSLVLPIFCFLINVSIFINNMTIFYLLMATNLLKHHDVVARIVTKLKNRCDILGLNIHQCTSVTKNKNTS